MNASERTVNGNSEQIIANERQEIKKDTQLVMDGQEKFEVPGNLNGDSFGVGDADDTGASTDANANTSNSECSPSSELKNQPPCAIIDLAAD